MCIYNQDDAIKKVRPDSPSGEFYRSIQSAKDYYEKTLLLFDVDNGIPTYMVDGNFSNEFYLNAFIQYAHDHGKKCCIRIRSSTLWSLNGIKNLNHNDWLLFDMGTEYELPLIKSKYEEIESFINADERPSIGVLFENYKLDVSHPGSSYYEDCVNQGAMPFEQFINCSSRSADLSALPLNGWGDYCGEKNNLTEKGGRTFYHAAFIYNYHDDCFWAFVDDGTVLTFAKTRPYVENYLTLNAAEYPIALGELKKTNPGNFSNYWILCLIAYLEQLKRNDYRR